MRLYQEIKNLGGGFCVEFDNCVIGLYSAVKNKDNKAVEIYFNKLDKWGLELYKQNKIINLALNDKTVGIPTFAINNILRGTK